MAKDPAMLWYWADWHSGTATMSRFLKGCYMDLLHAQFNSGPLSLEEIKTVLGSDFGTSWPTVQKKFKKSPEGLFFNERLEAEKDKRKKFTDSRRKNLSKPKDSHMEPHMESHMGTHMGSHMENANRNINKYSLAYFNKQGYSFPVAGKVASEIDRFLNYRAKHQLHGPIKSGEQVEAIILNFKDLNYTDEMISRAITDTIAKGAKNIICEQKPVTQQPTGPKIKNLT